MPPSRGVDRLETQAANHIARILLDCLVRLEESQFIKEQEMFQNPTLEATMEESNELRLKENIEEFNRLLLSLESQLSGIPGVLLNPVHSSLLSEYIRRFNILPEGQGVWVLTQGARAESVLRTMQAEFGYENSLKLGRIDIPSLRSVLPLVLLEKSIHLDLSSLLHLSTVSQNVFNEFKTALSHAIPKVKNLVSLNLSSPNNKTSLPQMENKHLQLIGQHCPNLEVLNISYNAAITGEGIRYLGPGKDIEEHQGCTKLRRLLIFDTGIFEKDLAKLIVELPELEYLGYKETGKMIRTLHKTRPEIVLNLTHIDNRGSKMRRIIVNSLRCKRPMIHAISEICPSVRNVKLRIADDDVTALSCLPKLESVELVYHVGTIQSPGIGTQIFLEASGSRLTSLCLICHNMTLQMINLVAVNCPNLTQLWFRSNHFLAGSTSEALPKEHNFLTKLTTLSLRVGENELYVVHNFPDTVLPFLLRNAPIKELLLTMRSHIITDSFVVKLFESCNLKGLEKLLLLVPGVNSIPGILRLTERTVEYVLNTCKDLKKLGNILTWSLGNHNMNICELVEPVRVPELMIKIKERNWDLNIINKKMTMR